MTKAKTTLAVFALIVTMFGAGALTAIYRGWGSQLVAVAVVNQSGQPLQSVTLNYQTCNGSGSLAVGALSPHQATTMHFAVCGEGGYTIEAVLSDGRLVKNNGAYVESGYSVSEVVLQNGIETNLHAYKL